MTRKQPETYRWFSSEILFVTAADMVRCVNEIRTFVGENNRIDIHPAQTGINLDGYFDLTDKLDQIQEIIKKHASFAMQEYSIKCVSVTYDGCFSGWCEQYNRHGDVIEGINLTDFFEEGTTYTGSAKGDSNATK